MSDMRARHVDLASVEFGVITFITRTDVHLSDQNPQSRKDDWSCALLGKLRQVGRIAEEEGATAVLDNGDFFHIKSPSRTSHALIRRVADVQSEYPCPTYGNVGNHDCIYGDYSYLDQQPLGVLMGTGVIRRCYDEHQHIFTDEDGTTVRLVGVPYHGVKYDMSRFKFTKGDEDRLVVMAHVLASPQGGSMFDNEDILKYHDLQSLSPDVDVWVFGHWHKDQGICQIGDSQFLNVGALSRGSLSQDNIDRIPAVGIIEIDSEGVRCRRRDLEVPGSSEVFNLEGRVREETRQESLAQFTQSIREALSSQAGGDSLEERVKGATYDEGLLYADEVRERALEYLEKASA